MSLKHSNRICIIILSIQLMVVHIIERCVARSRGCRAGVRRCRMVHVKNKLNKFCCVNETISLERMRLKSCWINNSQFSSATASWPDREVATFEDLYNVILLYTMNAKRDSRLSLTKVSPFYRLENQNAWNGALLAHLQIVVENVMRHIHTEQIEPNEYWWFHRHHRCKRWKKESPFLSHSIFSMAGFAAWYWIDNFQFSQWEFSWM